MINTGTFEFILQHSWALACDFSEQKMCDNGVECHQLLVGWTSEGPQRWKRDITSKR